MDAKLILTVEQCADRELWLKTRRQGIGGSDAGTILGFNKYKSAYTLWLEKTGQIEPKDLSDNEKVYWGNVFEESVAKRFSEITGKKIMRRGLMQSKKYPWMLANVDRLIVDEDAGLEIKTTGPDYDGEWNDDLIPDHYYWQCLHYLACTGCERWYIACLIAGQHMVWKCIEKDDVKEDIEALIEGERKFWEDNIIGRQLPPVDGSKNCSKSLNKRYKETVAKHIDFGDEVDIKCESLKKYQEEYKALEDVIEKLKNEIKVLMEDKETGDTANYKITFKYQGGKPEFDRVRFENDYPGLYNQYSTPTRNRQLRISKHKTKKEK